MAARVLVVGALADREAIAELLELAGFEVAVAALGEAAAAAARCVDAIIADIRTPELDGRAFAAALATIAPRPRAIVLSSSPCPAFATAGITCLVKPVKLDRLLAALAAPELAA